MLNVTEASRSRRRSWVNWTATGLLFLFGVVVIVFSMFVPEDRPIPEPWRIVTLVVYGALLLGYALGGRYMINRGLGDRSGVHIKLSNEKDHALDIYHYSALLWGRRVVLVDGNQVEVKTPLLSANKTFDIQLGEETPHHARVIIGAGWKGNRVEVEVDGERAATTL